MIDIICDGLTIQYCTITFLLALFCRACYYCNTCHGDVPDVRSIKKCRCANCKCVCAVAFTQDLLYTICGQGRIRVIPDLHPVYTYIGFVYNLRYVNKGV